MTDLAQAAAWHRQVAAIVEAADRAGVATGQLPTVRARLLAQQARFADMAARRGSALPALLATPAEIATAGPSLGDLSTPAVAQAMRSVLATLDAVDALLAGQPAPVGQPVGQPGAPVGVPPVGVPAVGVPAVGPGPAPGIVDGPPAGQGSPAGTQVAGQVPATPAGAGRWPAGLRNALVYGGYATPVLLVQLVLLVLLDEVTTLPLLAPVCLLVLPAFAWLAGWLTIGVAFPAPAGEPTTPRTPRLGAIICLLPNLALCAGLGVLFLAR